MTNVNQTRKLKAFNIDVQNNNKTKTKINKNMAHENLYINQVYVLTGGLS